MVPQELVQAYVEIVKAEPDNTAAAAQLVNLFLDVEKVNKVVADAIAEAKQRAAAYPAQ